MCSTPRFWTLFIRHTLGSEFKILDRNQSKTLSIALLVCLFSGFEALIYFRARKFFSCRLSNWWHLFFHCPKLFSFVDTCSKQNNRVNQLLKSIHFWNSVSTIFVWHKKVIFSLNLLADVSYGLVKILQYFIRIL